MNVIDRLERSGAGLHLKGPAGLLVMAPAGIVELYGLKAAKPEIRQHLIEHPEAECAERARITPSVDRFGWRSRRRDGRRTR